MKGKNNINKNQGEKKMASKQLFYKTCKYQGEYVSIIRAFYNGDDAGNWRYSIKTIAGDVHAQVDDSELSNFCL